MAWFKVFLSLTATRQQGLSQNAFELMDKSDSLRYLSQTLFTIEYETSFLVTKMNNKFQLCLYVLLRSLIHSKPFL